MTVSPLVGAHETIYMGQRDRVEDYLNFKELNLGSWLLHIANVHAHSALSIRKFLINLYPTGLDIQI